MSPDQLTKAWDVNCVCTHARNEVFRDRGGTLSCLLFQVGLAEIYRVTIGYLPPERQSNCRVSIIHHPVVLIFTYDGIVNDQKRNEGC